MLESNITSQFFNKRLDMCWSCTSLLIQVNRDTVLPWLGIKDQNTYNAIYIATPIDVVLSMIGGGSFNFQNSMVMFLLGAGASILGQWLNGAIVMKDAGAKAEVRY